MRTAFSLSLLLIACDSTPTPEAPPAPPPASVAPTAPPPSAEPPPATPEPPPAPPVAPPSSDAFTQAMDRAFAASAKNDAPGAAAGFEKALELRPKDANALAGLAEAQFAQNQQAAAVSNAEKAWAANPKDPQVRWTFGLIMLANKKRTAEAIEAWKALARENSGYAERLGIPARLEAIERFTKDPNHGKAPTKAAH